MDDKIIVRNRYSNYSKEDGEILKSIEYMDVTLEKDTDDTCKNCKSEINGEYNYCKVCGTQLYKTCTYNRSKGENNYKISKKNILLTALSSIIILLLVSVVYSSIIFKDLPEISNSMNILHVLLAMNIGTIDIYSSSMISSQAVSMKLGMLILIIWPVISLSISNLIFMKKNSKSIMVNSIGVGAAYGLALSIISILSTVGSNSYDIFKYGYSLGFGFRTFSLLVNGFIIGFACTFAWGIIKKGKIKNKYINIFKISVKTVAIGYMLVFALLVILNLSNNSYIHELGLYKYSSDLSIGVVLSQLAAYVWAFANLIPVEIGNSVLSIFTIGSSNLFLDTKLILLAMVALSSLMMLVIGSKLKSKYKEDSIKPVLVFSVLYSLCMGVLGTFTSIILSTGTTSISMGFGAILAIIISFIYSFVVALIGYKLSQFN